jgi:predicted PhzF superfamily epimerase YddE/YHI9
MKIPLYQVDAFASRLFAGNPAAVCPLERWLPDEILQSIAAENNLSETAFYVRPDARHGARYDLRWFTPAVEVDLCGHATLAAACVILEIRRETADSRVIFRTKSGELAVERDGGLYALDFPSRPPLPCVVHPGLAQALGAPPRAVLAARDYLCVFEREEQVVALAPDMAKLAEVDRFAVIVTAPGRDCDFVSRFFAPSRGVPEDPVTGSAHCTLVPYWAEQLGTTKLFARQRSRRGGELWCELRGDRIRIAGRAVPYMQAIIELNCSM